MSTAKAQFLLQRPQEISDRLRNKLDAWTARFSPACSLTKVANPSDLDLELAVMFPGATPPPLDGITVLEKHIASRQDRLRTKTAPFSESSCGTVTLGRLCYLACRYIRPHAVVETGVAYGVTSSYILQALAENSRGELHSIDLPPLAAKPEEHSGSFVPLELRSRWTLRIGPARRLLPATLETTAGVDMFVFDSLHTYSHMRWEFETALRCLRPGGVIVADDIDCNRAFEELLRRPEVSSGFAIKQERKHTLCGAARLRW